MIIDVTLTRALGVADVRTFDNPQDAEAFTVSGITGQGAVALIDVRHGGESESVEFTDAACARIYLRDLEAL